MARKKLKLIIIKNSKVAKRIAHIAIFLAASLIATECSQALTFV